MRGKEGRDDATGNRLDLEKSTRKMSNLPTEGRPATKPKLRERLERKGKCKLGFKALSLHLVSPALT